MKLKWWIALSTGLAVPHRPWHRKIPFSTMRSFTSFSPNTASNGRRMTPPWMRPWPRFGTATGASPPNIVSVLIDDVGFGDMGIPELNARAGI